MTYVAPSKAYRHLSRLLDWETGRKSTPAPVTLEWDLSERCYLGCQGCHFAHTHTRGPWAARDQRQPDDWEGVGDLANSKLVLRGLGQAKDAGVQGVVWTGGGEPTLHPDWTAIAKYAAAVGLKQGMYTAGGQLTSDTAALASQLLSWVVVSLDCADAATYHAEKGVDGWDAACLGAHALAEGPGDAVVGVSFLLHADNWQRAPEMVRLGRRLGADYVTFRPTIDTDPRSPATPPTPAEREWVTHAVAVLAELEAPDVECDPSRFLAYQQWEGRRYQTCYGIRLNATITADGRIWVCPNRRGMPESQIGDLRTESFAAAWARHPGQWTDFTDCRVMCRLHLVNEAIAPVLEPPDQHTEFI